MMKIKSNGNCWSTRTLLSRFFLNYLWIGIVMVLLAIVFDAKVSNPTFWQTTVVKIVETIGIAIMVAAIFTFASGTSEFIGRLQALLQDIVINRNFLGNVDAESKRRALAALIKPTDIERRLYANLDDYYDVFISNTLNITKKCVRSDYTIRARAFNDTSNKRIAVQQDIMYRVHPTKDGYDDIQVGFYDYDKLSRCDYVAVSAPDGTRQRFDNFDWKDVGEGAEKAKIATINLNEIGKHHPHLNVEVRVIEYGQDHWIPIGWRALQPTDGFNYTLHCEDDLKIKSHQYFVHGARFHVEQPSDREIAMSCHQWFNEGTGISIVVGSINTELQQSDEQNPEHIPPGGRGEAPRP